jgi:hypothetical protein
LNPSPKLNLIILDFRRGGLVVKFGLFYLFSDFGNIPQDQVFNEVLEEIEYGEELGFDSVWLPEHHFEVYGMLGNPMTLAAAISQRTYREEEARTAAVTTDCGDQRQRASLLH